MLLMHNITAKDLPAQGALKKASCPCWDSRKWFCSITLHVSWPSVRQQEPAAEIVERQTIAYTLDIKEYSRVAAQNGKAPSDQYQRRCHSLQSATCASHIRCFEAVHLGMPMQGWYCRRPTKIGTCQTGCACLAGGIDRHGTRRRFQWQYGICWTRRDCSHTVDNAYGHAPAPRQPAAQRPRQGGCCVPDKCSSTAAAHTAVICKDTVSCAEYALQCTLCCLSGAVCPHRGCPSSRASRAFLQLLPRWHMPKEMSSRQHIMPRHVSPPCMRG